MSWYYEGRELTSDDLVGMAGFVYEIHDLDTDRIYIGQKKASSRRKVNPTRKNGLKRPRRVTSESDWQEYWGSNEELKKLVSEHGPDRFRRVVLRLCKTKAEMSYYEMREQIMRDVLLKPDRYFNAFVGGKLHRNHLKHCWIGTPPHATASPSGESSTSHSEGKSRKRAVKPSPTSDV